MNRTRTRGVAAGAGLLAAAALALAVVEFRPRTITVDYPLEGSVFPPDFAAPTFLWRDADAKAAAWTIDIAFAGGGAPPIRVTAHGERMRIGEIDPRCVSDTNRLPDLTPEQAAAHTWVPDAATWAAIRKNSTGGPATLTFTGYRDSSMRRAASRGQVSIQTSKDLVGAPIFYRDVPLMPAETEKGVIKPLAPNAVPLIAWRLRNVAETGSRVLMTGIHSCANCHSVSRDGKTMGMDVDGPRNDKGLYAIFAIKPNAEIRNENVVAWSTFRGKLGGKLRVGFMSQVSPDGRDVVTTIMDPGKGQKDWERLEDPQDLVNNYYVANFKQYRFLQVFYPTRGVLAWYSAASGKLQPVPGADDAQYVHTNAVWSPDGKYLVFARAEAREPYPAGVPMAEQANDPNETQIKYDLYRIPFNGGAGGRPEPIAGASNNGMSNSFPKVSPDGRWIVWVQARNGQLMRPDSQLYIVPAAGGQPRRMRCNTTLMNSWHSFSPNGRWLVFSSKSRSPYTQMFLTHIDEQGNDTPAILIENSTAANRAVNIPEFVNVAPDGFQKIDTPALDYFSHVDAGSAALNEGKHLEAIPELQKAADMNPGEALVQNSLGSALAGARRYGEAIPHFRKAIQLAADYPDPYNNLGSALVESGKPGEAAPYFRKALELKPNHAEAHLSLGAVLAKQGRETEAIPHFQKAVELKPGDLMARSNLALALSATGRTAEAIVHAEEAVKLTGGRDPALLGFLGELYARAGRMAEAVDMTGRAMEIAAQGGDSQLADEFRARLAQYQGRR